MDLRKVKKLIELFEESQLQEMEISEGESVIRLSRGGTTQALQVVQAQPEAHIERPSVPVEQPQAVAADRSDPPGTVVTSPMVGTYYDAPSPDADAYVQVGSVVEAGDVLCIVEAMKTFNHIESEVSGVVRAIRKNTGEPVEYGEPLFIIE